MNLNSIFTVTKLIMYNNFIPWATPSQLHHCSDLSVSSAKLHMYLLKTYIPPFHSQAEFQSLSLKFDHIIYTNLQDQSIGYIYREYFGTFI